MRFWKHLSIVLLLDFLRIALLGAILQTDSDFAIAVVVVVVGGAAWSSNSCIEESISAEKMQRVNAWRKEEREPEREFCTIWAYGVAWRMVIVALNRLVMRKGEIKWEREREKALKSIFKSGKINKYATPNWKHWRKWKAEEMTVKWKRSNNNNNSNSKFKCQMYVYLLTGMERRRMEMTRRMRGSSYFLCAERASQIRRNVSFTGCRAVFEGTVLWFLFT